MKKPKENQKSEKQVTAFRRAARELGCDVSDDQFKETLRKIAKPPAAKAPPRSK